MNKKITAIIPTYNNGDYIATCIDSILNQTYKNFEIIVINDGSTDNTEKIVGEYVKNNQNIKLLNIKNNGAGYARNIGLKNASGDYIMFIDADDFIESVTFEVTVKRIIEDKSDFVYFDWKYYTEKGNNYVYPSKDKFMKNKILDSGYRSKLLKISSYFTVNKLYDKKFLEDNKIKYGEHYIYEDIFFWVKCVLSYKKISTIHSPLYNIRTNEKSTTKTKHDTDIHYKSFLKAYDESIKLFKKDEEKEKVVFIKYMIRRFISYYNVRTPKKYKKVFIREFYNRLSSYGLENIYKKSTINRILKKLKLLNKRCFFSLYVKKQFKNINKKRVKNEIKKIKRRIRKEKLSVNLENFNKYSENLKSQVLFMGFDYRYTGNSRYLYEEMKRDFKGKVLFATENEMVEESDRIIPLSENFYKMLYSSKIVIFESWIPRNFRKPEGAIWINLWHGTPLKKMLFDSNEEEILNTKPKHKAQKFRAIEKIDYLLTDNKEVARYFKTSFLISDDKLLCYGYPRVKYLIDNKNNNNLKKEIKQKVGVKSDQKVIAYLPTWRDYNYTKDENYDFDYFLDIKLLQKNLPKNYKIITKDHAFLSRNEELPKIDIETQELLLISDYLITDYSSVMFDALAIDLPICIIAKDYDKYSASRGLYDDIWTDLQPFVTNNEKDLANLIKNYKIDSKYKKIKTKYGYQKGGDLTEFIKNILNEKE